MKKEWLDWIRSNIFSVMFGSLGLVLMGLGLIKMDRTEDTQEIEIDLSKDGQISTVVVDVAGGVEQPGVFEMDDGARVADALIAAGGLSVDADRDWVARFINQAEPIKDGMKIFVPLEGEKEKVLEEEVLGEAVVNINTASKEELETLWGIGQARAETIIENRPYGSLDELNSKAGMPKNILEQNQGKITIY